MVSEEVRPGVYLHSTRRESLKCPLCGFEGSRKDFLYMYEVTLYLANSSVEREERERPVLAVCPRCRQGFLLEDQYSKLRSVSSL